MAGNEDATDPQCTIKTVPSVLAGNILNHVGPFLYFPPNTLTVSPAWTL